MAEPTLTNKFLILLGDGGDPTETFGAPCGVTNKSATFTKQTGEQVLLDCADPLGVQAYITRWMESGDTELKLSGRVSREAFSTWRAWADATGDAAVKNIQVEVDNNATDGGGYWQLPAIMTSFEIGTEGQSTMTMDMTIMGAGARTWVDAT